MPELMLTYHDDPMFRIIEIRRYTEDGSERVRSAWQYATNQPSWIARFALTVFLFIIMLPIVALLMIAFLVAVVVFLVLAVANAAISLIRMLVSGRSDGRENVRVVRRDEFTH
jgi:uncharacterized membrane protein